VSLCDILLSLDSKIKEQGEGGRSGKGDTLQQHSPPY
jgi:hypothetical protein